MSKKLSLHRRFSTALVLSIGSFILFAPRAQAQDSLHYRFNYFLTGDAVIGGTAVQSNNNGYASGTINIGLLRPDGSPAPNGSLPVPVTNGVPADIIAAYVYWQADVPLGTGIGAGNDPKADPA